MDETEVSRIASYIEDLERSFGDWDCREPARHRQLIKLHLTIERLTHMICEFDDEQLNSVMAGLENRARTCKQRLEAKLAAHS